MFTATDSVLLSADGKTSLFVRTWLPEGEPRAVLQLLHGLGEHLGRYERFARFMAENGFVVVGHDYLGHGKTVVDEADFGFVCEHDSWELLLADARAMHLRTRDAYPELPYFMFGHSMGSFLLRTYVIRYPGEQFGAILSGTGQLSRPVLLGGVLLSRFELWRHHPRYKSPLLIRLSFGSYKKRYPADLSQGSWLSADPEYVRAHAVDPYNNHGCTVSLYLAMLRAMLSIRRLKNLSRMDPHLRVLFISGAKDPVGNCGRGVRAAYNTFVKAGMRHVKLKLYPEGRHELLNDVMREDVYRYLLAWADKRMANKAGGKVTA